MSFKIAIQPSNHTFPVEPGQTILEAALDHGVTLPYSCRDGACGACKGKVLQGSVDHGKAQAFALSEENSKKEGPFSCSGDRALLYRVRCLTAESAPTGRGNTSCFHHEAHPSTTLTVDSGHDGSEFFR